MVVRKKKLDNVVFILTTVILIFILLLSLSEREHQETEPEIALTHQINENFLLDLGFVRACQATIDSNISICENQADTLECKKHYNVYTEMILLHNFVNGKCSVTIGNKQYDSDFCLNVKSDNCELLEGEEQNICLLLNKHIECWNDECKSNLERYYALRNGNYCKKEKSKLREIICESVLNRNCMETISSLAKDLETSHDILEHDQGDCDDIVNEELKENCLNKGTYQDGADTLFLNKK